MSAILVRTLHSRSTATVQVLFTEIDFKHWLQATHSYLCLLPGCMIKMFQCIVIGTNI